MAYRLKLDSDHTSRDVDGEPIREGDPLSWHRSWLSLLRTLYDHAPRDPRDHRVVPDKLSTLDFTPLSLIVGSLLDAGLVEERSTGAGRSVWRTTPGRADEAAGALRLLVLTEP